MSSIPKLLPISELLVSHYQRLAEMQSDPSARISHAELKKKLSEQQAERSKRAPER
jgi:hypothetical protein